MESYTQRSLGSRADTPRKPAAGDSGGHPKEGVVATVGVATSPNRRVGASAHQLPRMDLPTLRRQSSELERGIEPRTPSLPWRCSAV